MKKKWLKYYIFAIVSFFFHRSATIVLLLPIIRVLGIDKLFVVNKKTIFVLIAIFILATAVQSTFLHYIFELNIDERISSKAQSYMDSDLGGQVLNISGIIGLILTKILYPFIIIIYLKKHNIHFKYESMVFLCFVCAVLSIPIAIFYRYNNYFALFEIIIIADFSFSYLQKKLIAIRLNTYIIWSLLMTPLVAAQIYGYYGKVPGTELRIYMRYYPYNTVLNPQRNADSEKTFMHYHAY
jgi:hypothetical protein